MKKTTALLSLIAIMIIFAGGCIFAPYHPTNTYDLQATVIDPPPGTLIGVSEFDNKSGAGTKMRLRMNGYRIFDADYNKWVDAPGALFARCLDNSFNIPISGQGAVKYAVSGELTVFEADQKTRQFTVRGEYTVRGPNGSLSREFAVSAKYQHDSPDKFAVAASQATARVAAMIKSDVGIMCGKVKMNKSGKE